MERKTMGRSVLASALVAALSACGGGGGGSNVRIDPPPTTPPVTPPPTTPTPAKPTEPAVNAHLVQTNALAAQSAGLTGKGVRIGIVDSGVKRDTAALNGRVVANLNYVDPARNNLNVDDVVGHGTAVASLAAGATVGVWPGGIAPGAQIVSARIISDTSPTDDGSGQGNSFSGPLGVAGIHQDLISYGVKIMNNSWGGLYWTDLATTAQVAAEYRPFIMSNGGLVVFASGNEGRDQPSSVAALPSQRGVGGTLPAADLEKGWLVATAIDPNKPGERTSWANACGDAARYCLTAPGSAVFPERNGNGYQWNYGTSFAAPLVSGAAALVWERFPYFDNDLVRQTLLGTATDIGAPGVDAIYGYGLLNVGKAVNGPARFDWGNTTVNVSQLGLNSVWSNNITGSGGLVKQGEGSLGLSGTNTYTGDTRIERGTLALRDGASITSNVVITAQASSPNAAALQFMTGTTRVKGNVDNAAMVIVRDANSSATIEGNYLHRDGARLMISLGSSPLAITGRATLQGGDVHVSSVVSGYVPAAGRTQTVLQAGQGVSGTFNGVSNSLNAGSLLDAWLSYGSNDVTLNIDRVNVVSAASAAGLGASTQASASRVERAFEALDDGTDVTGVFAQGAGVLQGVQGNLALQQSLDSLSGKAHALATAATFDSIDLGRRALSARFGQVQGAPRLAGAWQNALGEAGQGSFSASGADTHGWMMGQDTALGSNGVLGFAFGETRSFGNRAWGSDRGRDRQSQAQLYAGWNAGGAYALGQLGAGQFNREIDRQLLLGAGQYGVNARYGGNFSTASVEAGYRFGWAGASLTPYLGADYTRVDSDRFSEQGGLGFGLRSAGDASSRSQALAGVRAERQWRNWALRGYAEWQQQLSSQGMDAQASFVGIDAWAPMAGLQPMRSGGLLGLSVESWLSRNSRLSFGYDQRFGPRGELSQVALRYSAAF
ncbi:autotransporter serine protease [Stenotrophomonas sp. ZAC14D2_NAIMI4_6]|uniref:autotransporter serine protease n=1 Tax=Stenotrophomonas sp. ZAC14D2_NAIMI4_6 TaxID=2072406 RepID=UPI000D53D0E6|nr:autotransporter serine protease [Stenotrophomonas sp. ZAC14D2_NAIMI4_6]AWH22296.1 autotransporter domain-containing protein [Stenotrophomonas sp. ZAC14D2_NAIMI4_6]